MGAVERSRKVALAKLRQIVQRAFRSRSKASDRAGPASGGVGSAAGPEAGGGAAGQEFSSPEEAYAILLSGKDKKTSLFAMAGGRQEGGVWQYNQGMIADRTRARATRMSSQQTNGAEGDSDSDLDGMGYTQQRASQPVGTHSAWRRPEPSEEASSRYRTIRTVQYQGLMSLVVVRAELVPRVTKVNVSVAHGARSPSKCRGHGSPTGRERRGKAARASMFAGQQQAPS